MVGSIFSQKGSGITCFSCLRFAERYEDKLWLCAFAMVLVSCWDGDENVLQMESHSENM